MRLIPFALFGLLAAAAAPAADISTHILDLGRGQGRAGVPVVLMRRGQGDAWAEVARATTDQAGRVRSFGPSERFAPGVYKLHFALPCRPDDCPGTFFPEIDLVFRASDAAAHYHVPLVLSAYGYSTYRGN